ncbi:MAG: monovalent cation/H+ antiporter subunit D family protein [Rhodospirillaceae bacterium]|nr:monovalent cation/H+ antiporter subunit D family protein [Rhodospirillaceae bacterium]
MSPAASLIAALCIPAAAALLIGLAGRKPNLREAITLVAAAALFIVVASLLPGVLAGERPATGAWRVLPGVELRLALEPLGMLFALVASFLWIVNSLYSIGYMRANDEPRQTPYYMCFAVALAAALGIAFSANLFTLFLFYELLTLSTYPLVVHKQTPEAIRAGRVYLLMLIGSSIVLLLSAIIWVYARTGTGDFKPGGIIAGTFSPGEVGILLALFAFGIGKAALMPMHRWLPAAMVAPTPVSALLHAVAVVKAGVFTVLKVVVYVFGTDFLAASGANVWLMYVAAASLVLASAIALFKDNLKARLAYSTVSQLAYIVLAGAMASKWSIVGGGMHIAMHAFGKITLFFCAGAIYTALHKTEISEMRGIGRAMPVTMTAFLIGAISVCGLPPGGGTWSKWYLTLAAAEADRLILVGALLLSTLLNIAYFMPIVARAWFVPMPRAVSVGAAAAPHGEHSGIREAPWPCLVAISITAAGCVALFFFAGDIYALLEPLTRSR